MLSIAQIIHSLARPFHEKSKNKLNFTELLDVVYRRSSCNCMIFTSNLIFNLIIIFLLNQISFHKPAMRNKKDPVLELIFDGASRSNALVDSHPEHIGRRTKILLVVCILFRELCECLTFYGILWQTLCCTAETTWSLRHHCPAVSVLHFKVDYSDFFV